MCIVAPMVDGLCFGEERDESALGVASRVHAGDDFLAEVAAFGETDAVFDHSGFGGQRAWSEVDVVEGRAALDAGDVEGVPAARAEADLCGEFGGKVGGDAFVDVLVREAALEEEFVDGAGVLSGDDEIESDLAGLVAAIDDDLGFAESNHGGLICSERRDSRAAGRS